jgi:hypothetical protein
MTAILSHILATMDLALDLFGQVRAYCTSSLIQLPSTMPYPADSASLTASRSMARLIASRTRLSWNGFLGS